MGNRLQGKVCVITGTAGGIGKASALAFSREGAAIVGCDVAADEAQQTMDEVRAEGGRMISLHPIDLAKKADCERLVSTALAEFGRIDVLVNNAGRLHHGWMHEGTDDFWYDTIDDELNIVFRMCRAAWPALTDSAGVIVNLASTIAHTGFRKLGGLAHSAAKGGVVAMTRHLAMEGREAGIRANSISPGVIGSGKVLAFAEADPEWDALMRGRMMRGRYGTPEQIAAVALFLASDESSFVNAADIIADDGVTVWG